MIRINRIGQRYGKLVVIGPFKRRRTSAGRALLFWRCKCDCGTKLWVCSGELVRGGTTACGCMKGAKLRHGFARKKKLPEYITWILMKRRCYNNNCADYPFYGGIGIRVCNRWLNSFENFLADMGRRPSREYSIDRIDNAKGYYPGNCRWATATEQARNRKRSHLTNEIEGVVHILRKNGFKIREIAERLDVPIGTVSYALYYLRKKVDGTVVREK